MLVAGVDEAGRGCVIGPLVVAGIAVQAENVVALEQLGVKDSKLLTPKKRESLYEQILQTIHIHHVEKVAPCIIDRAVECTIKNQKLNRLEAQTMAKIIEHLNPDQAYVDAADIVEEKFGLYIKECLKCRPQIISKHKADLLFPVVSAASIIAKVERDREIEALRLEFGDFGSGYMHDKKTLAFLKSWVADNDDYPLCVRKSWKPAKRILSEKGSLQKTLN
jgi:ribonuclease HII